ncbi:unnamed protein product [Caenorhabditis angaria]|uniref:Uncharacterized protein n=1 Tax=Caenorhabditis angaria TaxID=860376 RepID=A0A9P1I339_9PELO|nr:unnamed protein product [Caenorhabditis angaria]
MTAEKRRRIFTGVHRGDDFKGDLKLADHFVETPLIIMISSNVMGLGMFMMLKIILFFRLTLDAPPTPTPNANIGTISTEDSQ